MVILKGKVLFFHYDRLVTVPVCMKLSMRESMQNLSGKGRKRIGLLMMVWTDIFWI